MNLDLGECPWGKKIGGLAVRCFGVECNDRIHHLECTELKHVPKNKWICPKCKKVAKKIKESEAQKDGGGEIFGEGDESILEDVAIDLTDVPSAQITQDDIDYGNRIDFEVRRSLFLAGGRDRNRILTVEHWLKLGRSGISGRGIFAVKDLPRNLVLIEYTGERITKAEQDFREKQYKKDGVTAFYFFGLDERTVIDPTKKDGNNARFVNHACTPNVRTKVMNDKLYFIAKYHIFAGDELTVNYHLEKEEGAPRIRCKCGKPRCK